MVVSLLPQALQVGFISRILNSEWLIILTMCLLQVFAGSIAALPMPFYPQEAQKRGVSATEYGIIFGIYYLSGILWSLALGKRIARFGTKNILCFAVAVSSVSSVCFGLLEYVYSYGVFVGLSFLLRITEAIGAHSIKISLSTAAADAFPEKRGTMVGAISTANAVGAVIGPALGSLIFVVGGYKLPFIVLGLVLIISGVVVLLLIPTSSPSAINSSVSLWKLILIPGVMLDCFYLLSGFLSITFIQTVLETLLDDFHLHVITKGLVFVIAPFVFTIFSPVFGRISDKFKKLKRFLLAGSTLTIVSFIIIGPAPYTGIPKNLHLLIFGMVLQGLAESIVLVVPRNDSISSALASGEQYGVPLLGVLSSMWTASISLGAFIGSSLSGYLYDTVGFQYGSLLIDALYALLAVFTIVVMITTKN